jgi:hypothetical protein
MAADEVALKSPFVPLFQRGSLNAVFNSSPSLLALPLFGKEGKGRFLAE